ncbi:MAG: acylphosphatase [Thiomonas delicata]
MRQALEAPMAGLEPVCRRCIVTGRVQGVSFRAYTRAEALRLGLRGHARNLPDGSVEVLACGEAQAVEALCRWLWQGSPASRVEAVRMEDGAGVVAPPGFSIG